MSRLNFAQCLLAGDEIPGEPYFDPDAGKWKQWTATLAGGFEAALERREDALPSYWSRSAKQETR